MLAHYAGLDRRKVIKKVLLVLLMLTPLANCSSNAGGYTNTADVEKRLIGMSESTLATTLGAPNSQTKLSNGAAAWTYRVNDPSVTGGMCTVTTVLNNGFVTDATVISRDRSWVSFPLGACAQLLARLD